MKNIRVTEQSLELQLKANSMSSSPPSSTTTPAELFHDALESASSLRSRLEYFANASWKKFNALCQSLRGGGSHPSKAMLNGAAEENSGPDSPERLLSSFEGAVVFLENFFDVRIFDYSSPLFFTISNSFSLFLKISLEFFLIPANCLQLNDQHHLDTSVIHDSVNFLYFIFFLHLYVFDCLIYSQVFLFNKL